MMGFTPLSMELINIQEIGFQITNRNCSANVKQKPLQNSGYLYQQVVFNVTYLEDKKSYSVSVRPINAPVTHEPT
jgi:hypothetical protein